MNAKPRVSNLEALSNYMDGKEVYGFGLKPDKVPEPWITPYRKPKTEIIDFEEYPIDDDEEWVSKREWRREFSKHPFVRKAGQAWVRMKIKTDPVYKLADLIRSRLWEQFKRIGEPKSDYTRNILGCTFEEFKAYIEAKWEPWMNWDNYGNRAYEKGARNKSWDLDHIIPVSTAKTEEDVIRLNHYTNFQPLCSFVNRHIKRDNVSIN